jgi:hypothetical protein
MYIFVAVFSASQFSAVCVLDLVERGRIVLGEYSLGAQGQTRWMAIRFGGQRSEGVRNQTRIFTIG